MEKEVWMYFKVFIKIIYKWDDQEDENCQKIPISFSKFSFSFLIFISMCWPKTAISLRAMRQRSYKKLVRLNLYKTLHKHYVLGLWLKAAHGKTLRRNAVWEAVTESSLLI